VAINHLDCDAGLVPQCIRHTGGMLSGPSSRRTLADGYLFHRSISN
jgi:hypothetical protein